MSTCLNCNRAEQEYPLIKLTYQGKKLYICPQCLPVLIHKPQNLTDKIPNFTPPANSQPHEN
jgi:hypothetical protein